jgi:hypothetical protein
MAATLLLNGTFMSFTQNTVESANYASAAVWQSSQRMTRETEAILIENYAAPYWNMSATEAWYQYEVTHQLKITELQAEVHYLIEYDGILDVTVDDGNF